MSYHTALYATPFEVVYGWPPSPLFPHQAGATQFEQADALLRDRNSFLVDIHEHLLQARNYTKYHYHRHHPGLEFAMGDWMWLRLLHRTTQSLKTLAKVSSVLATPDRFMLSSALGRWPIAWGYQRALVYVMSSMWGCSNPSRANLQRRVTPYF